MRIEQLNTKHGKYDHCKWERYEAVLKGGDEFAENIKHFLPQLTMEPHSLYADRCTMAKTSYENHIAHIVSAAETQLFNFPFSIRNKENSEANLDVFYSIFKENCDGKGTDLTEFMRARFIESLTTGQAIWEVSVTVDRSNAASFYSSFSAKLINHDIEQLFDYGCDEDGNLDWVVLHSKSTQRAKPGMPLMAKEVWRVIDRFNESRFEIVYDPTKPPNPKTELEPSVTEHGLGFVPIIIMHLNDELALVPRAYATAIKLFNQDFGLNWAAKRLNFPTPILKVNDTEQRPPSLSLGQALIINRDEDLEWMVPPSDSFEVQLAMIKRTQQELYRICNAQALGVDNQAAAIGRSGMSKAVDVAINETGLQRFGSIVRLAVERTYQMLSSIRGESIQWDVSGLDRFAGQLKGTTIDEIISIMNLGLPSRTLKIELENFLSEVALPALPQGIKNNIRQELEQGTPWNQTPQTLNN